MTAKDDARLSAKEVEAFLVGRPIFAFDPGAPEAGTALVAIVHYEPGGNCSFERGDGGRETGQWGLNGDGYWTQYQTFRDGTKNEFFLRWVAPDVAQAYFKDGTRAFLQTGRESLDGLYDADT